MGISGGPDIIQDGLILSLDASDKNSYPGSGTTWFDLSGNGNHGTISSGEFISSNNGGYLQNTGNVSNFFYISVPHSNSLNNTLTTTTGGWTIEEIIMTYSTNYPEADAGAVASDVAYSPGATGFDWNHGYDVNSFAFGQSSNPPSGYEDNVVIATSPYNLFNTWRIRTMIWNRGANTVSLYINGTYVGGGSTPNTAGTSIYDGSGILFGTLYGWKHFGRRSSLKIYNKVLSAAEILQNYNAQKSRFNL